MSLLALSFQESQAAQAGSGPCILALVRLLWRLRAHMRQLFSSRGLRICNVVMMVDECTLLMFSLRLA
jgi:hypothetical protein